MTKTSGARPNHRKHRMGLVVSDKMAQTVVVSLERRYQHPLYGKQMRRTKKVAAHDTMGAKIGDRVRIAETRPLSKTKRWRVVEIVVRAEGSDA